MLTKNSTKAFIEYPLKSKTVKLCFCCTRFKLLSARMKSKELHLHNKMKWERLWATTMRQPGNEFWSSWSVFLQLWRTLELISVPYDAPLIQIYSLDGWRLWWYTLNSFFSWTFAKSRNWCDVCLLGSRWGIHTLINLYFLQFKFEESHNGFIYQWLTAKVFFNWYWITTFWFSLSCTVTILSCWKLLKHNAITRSSLLHIYEY